MRKTRDAMEHRQRPEDVPILKPSSLFTERASRDKARLKAYNQLLEQIYNRIKNASRIPGNTSILYTVPPFILGLPKLDLEDCIVYLVFQLRTASYEVNYTYPNLLYVSWRQHERAYIIHDSPIIKAMLPPEPIKGKKTTPTTRQSYQPVKSAGEYTPPNAFLNAVSGGLGEDPQRKRDVLDTLFNF